MNITFKLISIAVLFVLFIKANPRWLKIVLLILIGSQVISFLPALFKLIGGLI